ncbi:MAG: transcriptional regulator [Aestuariivita sp.]|nr:transcriptional regulator [Aestuariivita sp.]
MTPHVRNFRDTIRARAHRDPEFRFGLFREALEALLNDDLETGKILLRAYINATIGFDTLAVELDKHPKSLMRMLSDKGNPRADNLLGMVGYLKKRENAALNVTRATEPVHT